MRLDPIWLDYSVARMYEALEAYTVAEVAQEMRKLGCGHNCCQVSIMGDSWREVDALLSLPIHRTQAKYISCKFYGGPPGKQAIFSGSLITMLMDRMMQQSLNEKPLILTEQYSEN